MRYAVHGVHYAAADQAFAGREEEQARDEDVGGCRDVEIYMRGVEVEGYTEDDEEAEQVRPDVCGFVVDATDGADAGPVALAEAIAVQDVRVDLPWFREVFELDQAMLFCAGEGALDCEVDPEFNRLSRAVRFVEACVYDCPRALQLVVRGLDSCISDCVCAGLEVGYPIFH